MTYHGRRRSRSARRTTTLSEVSTLPPYRFLWNVSIVFYVYGKQFRGKGERQNYDYRVDCCEISDPDRDPSLNGHAGFHDSILERTYANVQCKDLIGDFLWWIMMRSEGTRRLHVGVYCVRSRHRSTAMAWILTLMTQALGCQSVHTVYMERQAGNWSRLCIVCDSCAWSSDAKAMFAEKVEEDTRDLVKSFRRSLT